MIGRQLLGEPLRGKRLVVLPVVLTVIGMLQLQGHRATSIDVVLIALSGLAAAAIGLGQGRLLRLESHDGVLWGQLPLNGLWLWLSLVASRFVIYVVASGVHAHLAASLTPIMLVLGINRVAQAAVVAPRAWSAGILFAPEKDGSTFGDHTLAARPPVCRRDAAREVGTSLDWRGIATHVEDYRQSQQR